MRNNTTAHRVLPMNRYSCRVCGGQRQEAAYTVREMMFGTREAFEYDQCYTCYSLQISNIPDKEVLSRHYPEGYYSFSEESLSGVSSQKGRFVHWLIDRRDKASLGQMSLLGKMLKAVKPAPLPLSILRSAGLRIGQQVLDVGCGAGSLLNRLAALGFVDLLGIDPFIDSDRTTRSGVSIRKASLFEVQDSFDIIMFHHSFEHVPSPRDELLAAYWKLRPDGRVLIRIPTPSSEAWEKYGTDWVQLDAPRHLTLISRSGMTILAEQCGFSVVSVIDDSEGWSLMASELYRRGIPFSEQSFASHFSSDVIDAYEMRAKAANAANRGDQAAFILAKSA
jgi:2-polyprenyl-3-methyl-5-hydroxy-6-metoxy-1,4-benzoquinol methylase